MIMPRAIRKWSLISVLFFCFLPVNVVGYSTGFAQEKEMTINVHVPGATTNTMPFVMGVKQGYFKREGLNPNLIRLLGPDINVENISLLDCVAVESMRHGLSRMSGFNFLAEGAKV